MAKVLLVKSRLRALRNPEVVPPMGLLYIAAYLRKMRRDEVKIVDANLRHFSPTRLNRILNSWKPDVVGISALTAEATFLHELAKSIKATLPRTTIVAGGHYPSSEPNRVLKDCSVDLVIEGEGEETMKEWLDCYESGKAWDSVAGLHYRKDGEIVATPARPLIQDLDSLPFPAWDLLDLDAYFHHATMGSRPKSPYMSLVTSRGCPYHCIYCHLLHGKRFRPRSPENILAECQALHKIGVRELLIIDDIFNADLDRAKAILQCLKQQPFSFKIHFPNALRGDRCDTEFLQLLREAGTELLCLAIESGSPRIQKFVKRNLNLEKIRATIAQARKAGLYTMGFFILGFPTETHAEMEQTIAFARRSELHSASFFILLPHPGTELGEKYYPHIFNDYLFHDGFLPPKLMFNRTKVSNREISKLLLKAHLQFYLAPHRLIRGPWRYLFRQYTEFLVQLPPRLLPILSSS